MDNQDKIFDKFKDAAHNAELKDFPGMEKVWSRVEEKLDKKEDKKAISLWKKVSIAASLLLLISLGSQFIKTDKKVTIQNTYKVVTNETQKELLSEPDSKKGKVAVSEDSGIVSKSEAVKILENQTKQKEVVAMQEVQASSVDNMPIVEASDKKSSDEAVFLSGTSSGSGPAPSLTSGYLSDEKAVTKDKAFVSAELSKSAKRESYQIADSEKESQLAKKSSAPLVIMNGRALSHSNEEKRDKMMQNELSNMSPENVESLVILDEPLYIIDGNYYSEDDLFGRNPKSPYAPLNKQEIKTITILQDTEATDKYGDKGKKGVVIITTKSGKPALKQ
ncbi:hypothetical protein EV144_10350 [Flavobacterium sp. 270]|uniref:hypothetical protein n=1 Tax=Flavobacterium sp. 270 TaxID=2512114 RepID=UPI0010662C48|nr:hypothetical protein [Flavobacterium sp. 270]TDW48542.1 hypothetical protein EV144_10350 [Flavobacterium sp. 270]